MNSRRKESYIIVLSGHLLSVKKLLENRPYRPNIHQPSTSHNISTYLPKPPPAGFNPQSIFLKNIVLPDHFQENALQCRSLHRIFRKSIFTGKQLEQLCQRKSAFALVGYFESRCHIVCHAGPRYVRHEGLCFDQVIAGSASKVDFVIGISGRKFLASTNG
jgi:hypothetical protein